MATCVQPAATSQSTSCSRSTVIVPKVRTSLVGRPCAPGTIKQATTVALCTSTPQHRACTTSILVLPSALLSCSLPTVRGNAPVSDSEVRAPLPGATVGATWGHSGQSSARARSTRQTPTFVRPHRLLSTIPRAAPHFHPRWWPTGPWISSAFLKWLVCDQGYWRYENQTPVCASTDGRGAPGLAGQPARLRRLCPAPGADRAGERRRGAQRPDRPAR